MVVVSGFWFNQFSVGFMKIIITNDFTLSVNYLFLVLIGMVSFYFYFLFLTFLSVKET